MFVGKNASIFTDFAGNELNSVDNVSISLHNSLLVKTATPE